MVTPHTPVIRLLEEAKMHQAVNGKMREGDRPKTVRFPSSILEQLDDYAKRNDRSVSDVVRAAVHAYINEERQAS